MHQWSECSKQLVLATWLMVLSLETVGSPGGGCNSCQGSNYPAPNISLFRGKINIKKGVTIRAYIGWRHGSSGGALA
jgi:hypothetical protein